MRIVLIFLFALNTFYGFSQDVCNTELKDQDLSKQAELDSLAAQLNGVQFRLEAELSYFKVRHVIILSSGETDNIASHIPAMMQTLNMFYINANVQFITCDYEVIYDNNLNDFDTPKEGLLPNKQNTINIYYISSVKSNGARAGGYTYLPSHYTNFMLIEKASLLSGNIYAVILHEMGHYFGLHHTHGKKNAGCGTDEFVDRDHRIGLGLSCKLLGDGLCDTPADPNLSSGCAINQFQCVSSVYNLIYQTDAHGNLYSPNFGNIMSYNRYGIAGCVNNFTSQQYSRMFSYSRIKPRAYERFIPSNGTIANWNSLNMVNNKFYIGLPFMQWMDAAKYYHAEGIVVSNASIDNSQEIHFKANSFVKLTNGFVVKNNSSLKIEIGPNCANQAPVPLFREAEDLDLKYEERALNVKFHIFPNPASQNVNIEIGELPYNEFKVSLVNVLGEKVFSKYFRIVSEKSVGLSLEGMPKGYYNVLFESGDKLISEPLIVQ